MQAASSSEVLPWAFGPTMKFSPGANSVSNRSKQRKWRIAIRVSVIRLSRGASSTDDARFAQIRDGVGTPVWRWLPLRGLGIRRKREICGLVFVPANLRIAIARKVRQAPRLHASAAWLPRLLSRRLRAPKLRPPCVANGRRALWLPRIRRPDARTDRA